MADAGFEPGTFAPEVWRAANEPPHLILHFLIYQLPPNILASSSFSLKMGLSENCAKTEGLGSLRLVCGQLL